MTWLPDHVASCVPFLAAGVSHRDNPPARQVAVRLAEIGIVVAFLTWSVDKLERRLDQLGERVHAVRTEVSVLARGELARADSDGRLRDQLKDLAARVHTLEVAPTPAPPR